MSDELIVEHLNTILVALWQYGGQDPTRVVLPPGGLRQFAVDALKHTNLSGREVHLLVKRLRRLKCVSYTRERGCSSVYKLEAHTVNLETLRAHRNRRRH